MLHDDLDRLGLPSDRPLHVTIAANRMMRVLDALPEAVKARDAAWAGSSPLYSSSAANTPR